MRRWRAWRSSWRCVWLSPRRLRFWLLMALALYTLAGFFLLPWLIERGAVKALSEVDRSFRLGAVKVNPFVLDMELKDVELRDTDGERLFTCDDFYLNFQLSSLFHRAWVFRELRLLKPYFNLERYRSGEDRIGNLVAAFVGDDASGEALAPSAASVPRLLFHHLELLHGKVTFTDHIEDQEFSTEFGPIQASYSDFSTLPDRAGSEQVSVATRSGGSIAWSGKLQLVPLLLQGHLTISGQAFEDVHRYLNLLLPFSVKSGGADIAFDYRVTLPQQGEPVLAVENLAGAVTDIRLRLADAGAEVVLLPQVKFAGAALHWPEKTLRLDSLAIDAAQLNIVRLPDGSIDLQQLLPAATAQAQARTEASPADAWAIDLRQLLLTGAAVSFQDRTLEPAAVAGVHGLKLSASGISNRPDARFPTRLDLELTGGGTLSFDGETGVLPAFSAAGEVTAQRAELAVAQPWIARMAHVAVASGTASLKGRIDHAPAEIAGYQGSARIDGFELTDTNRGEQLLALESLGVEQLKFSLSHRSIETSELKLTRPYGRISIAADKTTNLTGLWVEAASAANAGGSEAAASPLTVTLGGFAIKDASLDFSDRSLPLPFAAAIRTMNGTVSTLSNATTEAAKIRLEGQVDDYGLARITGSIDVWSFAAYSDLKIIFRNLETARLSPYSIGFAGYKIADGRLDLDLDYQIRDGKMLGANKIVSRQLRLGERVETPGGASLPLKLAVALLTDSTGVIDVDLPVSGDINDPQFRLGGVVTKAILRLIGSAITSPFRLLGKLVGVDSEDFGALSFAPGSAAISPPDREKLVKLAAAMQQRPHLALEVGGVYAAADDRAALQAMHIDAEIDARVEAQKQHSEEFSTVLRRRAAEALFEQTFPGVTLESVQVEYMRTAASAEESPAQPELDETAYLAGLHQRLVAHEQVEDAELARLAGARADAVIGALQDSGEGAKLSLKRLDAQAVKATKSGEIPLALKVSAGGRGE